jgi:uncharacterized protein YhbP (UPF0306 family)
MGQSGLPDPRVGNDRTPAERVRHLLDNGRFVTLATTDGTRPWASTVNYVPLRAPLRLLWYSMRAARHSRNIAIRPQISGAIHLTGLPGFGLDGAQFTGVARAIGGAELPELHRRYCALNFPDDETRQRLMPPEDEFADGGPRGFYVFEVAQTWLLDIDRWLVDKCDQRVAVAEF